MQTDDNRGACKLQTVDLSAQPPSAMPASRSGSDRKGPDVGVPW